MTITLTVPPDAAGIVTIEAVGDIDLAAVTTLREQVDALLATEAVTGIVLDLAGVHFLDSSGIGALVGSLRAAQERGRSLRVVHANGLVRDVLELTNVLPLLTEPESN
ncbi:MAG TPA: STAS domain-containing protein [Micromonosporaceae bacterium]|jgi:anti-sigma B factor antagonist